MFVHAFIKIHLSIMKEVFDVILNVLVYRGKCLIQISRTIVISMKLLHVIVNDFDYQGIFLIKNIEVMAI